MQTIQNNQHLALALSISYVSDVHNQKYYSLNACWSDGGDWNPSSKDSCTSYSCIGAGDLLLNVMKTVEVTFCNRVLIIVEQDEELRENLKVLTGQSVSKTKAQVLSKVAYNANEKAKLSSMFRNVNIEVF